VGEPAATSLPQLEHTIIPPFTWPELRSVPPALLQRFLSWVTGDALLRS
jgi:hypothetical protein